VSSENRPVHIVTDSTADLIPEWIGDLPITVVPLTVDIEGTSYRDRIDLTTDEFVHYLRGGIFPKTSQPSIGAFQEEFQKILDDGKDIVSIHISSQLSGTMNSATQAKSSIGTESIHIVDSGTVSMGFGFLALEAAEMARNGQPAHEIASYIEQRKRDQRLYATLESLEYLRKGGRIGRAAAMLGSALQLKPIIQVRDGVVEPVERVRTYRRALARLTDIYNENQPFDKVAIMHLDAESEATKLVEQIREIQPDVSILIGNLGPVIGTYGGPGLVGLTGLVSRG
jgi:DegV family protein with EDD domain